MPSSLRSRAGLPRHLRPWRGGKFLFGVAYYPEHWPRRDWARDLDLMRKNGVRVIRLGEFAWDVWEPRAGAYRFELFDAVIALAAARGLKVILGTPTSGPPRWLTAAHPEWLRHAADGQPIDHGGRQHASPMQAGFRAVCRSLVTALAQHYARHPAVIGWQVDNELHCVGALDFSAAAEQQFQAWLTRRFGRIERLNRAWGTAFSAQTYGDFAEVPVPLLGRPDGFPPHPAHLLEFQRFTSDVTLAFAAEQAAVLRAANPRWLVFHNGLFPHLDYWTMAGQMDLGVDLYPGFGGPSGPAAGAWSAFKLEQCRAHAGAFLVPELTTGAAGSQKKFVENPEPGQMRLWAWQCIAHGAAGLIHFRWRTCRFGQEIHWRGVLDHDARPRRRLRELAQEAAEISRLTPRLAGAVRPIEVGILIDHDQEDAHGAVFGTTYPAPRHQAEHLLGALLARHIDAGLVHARDSLRGLRAVIVPSFACIAPDLAARLEAFARAGGTVICTAHTGTRDAFNQALVTTAPGPLAKLCGASVEEIGGLRTPLLALVPDGGDAIGHQPGYEILRPRSARTIARWAMTDATPRRQPHPAHDQPAATRRKVGRGAAILVGVWLNADNAGPIAQWLTQLAGWRPLVEAATGVHATRLRTPRGSLLFLLNHTPEPQRVAGLPRGRELITARAIGRKIDLPPYGVAIIAPHTGRSSM